MTSNVLTRITGIALAGAMLAACSSGGAGTAGGVTPTAQNSAHKTFAWTGKTGFIKIRIKVPSRKERQRIAKLVAHAAAETPAGRVKPKYLPASATTVCFSLVSVNGNTTGDDGLCDDRNAFDFALDTSDTSACTAVGSGATAGYSCTATEPAPAAADSWTVVASDTNATSLSEAYYTVTVDPESTATPGFFTLNPIATGLSWTAGTSADYGFTNGQGTPVYASASYTCPAPVSGGCYDPLLNGDPTTEGGGTATSDTATLNVLDADGNTIIPTADLTNGVSGSPNIPIYLDTSGDELAIHVTCDDPDVELVIGSAPYDYAALSALSNPNADLANGAHSATGANVQFVGPGNVDSSNYPTFNSPYTGADGTSGGGTNGSGVVISDDIYGNNGAFVNYDGGGNRSSQYSLDSLVTCIAHLGESTSGGASATYYVGLAEGQITWGANGKHHRSKSPRVK